ncbi:MAG TPA: helix-turn-helix domain-containing protein [Gemmatimonadales bacterium]|nr:helix-turn-helix domain-containing protein [Gemmatimonadales bacterium]
MLVLAAVGRARFLKLRAAAAEQCEFVAATGWAEAVELIRHRPVEVAVVDPLLAGGAPRTHEIERLRVLFPSLPLLAYTALAPDSAAALLELGRIGVRRAVFERFDDDPASLRAALRQQMELAASQQVVQALSECFAVLPERLRWAVEATLHAGPDLPRVTDLAARARLRPRSCERWFARTGLPSPNTVLRLARMLYAHRLLLDPGYTVEDVALKLGYRKAKSLQMHLKDVFGLTAGELRVSLSPREAIEIVRARCEPGARRAAS